MRRCARNLADRPRPSPGTEGALVGLVMNDSAPRSPAPGNPGVVTLLKRMVDSVEHLVEDHLELARLELSEDARRLVRQSVEVGKFVPLMLAGLIVVLLGLAVLLGQALGLWIGLLLVGGVTLLGGVAGALAALRRNRGNTDRMLNATRQEAFETKAILSQLGQAPPRLETRSAG